MKTKLALATALAAALMLALFLVGCSGTAQTHPRTVKDVDLTKYEGMEVGNLVVVFPDGKEKKYDVATDFWAEQAEDNVWFYDEYKYALVIEKGVVSTTGQRQSKPQEALYGLVVLEPVYGENSSFKIAGTQAAVHIDSSRACNRGDTVIVCGNIDDAPNDHPELIRNTQVLVV